MGLRLFWRQNEDKPWASLCHITLVRRKDGRGAERDEITHRLQEGRHGRMWNVLAEWSSLEDSVVTHQDIKNKISNSHIVHHTNLRWIAQWNKLGQTNLDMSRSYFTTSYFIITPNGGICCTFSYLNLDKCSIKIQYFTLLSHSCFFTVV